MSIISVAACERTTRTARTSSCSLVTVPLIGTVTKVQKNFVLSGLEQVVAITGLSLAEQGRLLVVSVDKVIPRDGIDDIVKVVTDRLTTYGVAFGAPDVSHYSPRVQPAPAMYVI